MAEAPKPGETIPTPIELGDCDTRFVPQLLLDASSNLELGLPHILQSTQAFVMPPSILVDGAPVAQREGGLLGVRGALDSFQKLDRPSDPATLELAGVWQRWLPYATYLDPPANGGRRWWPTVSARTNDSPRISLYTINPASSTGRGVYGERSPGIAASYEYQAHGQRLRRPAMVFDGLAAASIDPERTLTKCTLGFVAVLHPSAQRYYGIFEAASQGFGEPLAIRYAHGRIDVFQNHTRVVSHETQKPASYPVVFMLSMNAETDTGRMYCIDQTRTTRVFNIAGLEFVSFLGVLGALGQGTTDSKWRFGSEMDLLDLMIWDRRMDFAEMESVASELALAYGIAS